MADHLIVLHVDFAVGLLDCCILFLGTQLVLKLLEVREFWRLLVLDQEQSWVTDWLGWGQELALLFEVLTIADSGGGGFFVLDTLNHLIEVEAYRQLLGALTIGVHDEEVTLFVLSPHTTLVQVNSVDTWATLKRHTKDLKEVIVILLPEILLLSNAV